MAYSIVTSFFLRKFQGRGTTARADNPEAKYCVAGKRRNHPETRLRPCHVNAAGIGRD
ncbi:hypothetical protein [Bradyrhizobium japonicum]|uniref:hypothetical protein n=1 Tax=Bradyrhizobium japonicum TaxID=375 RepID=UPI001BA8F989|nr:hypothetical protein [Bradyrhizobium japonicum]MBR0957734.1 hypothetical protein [Bradyrhizobium japonicum]